MADDTPTAYPYPPWKRALQLFFEQEFKPGDTLTHEWLHEAFEIPMETRMMPVWEADRNRLLLINQLGAFKEALLREHQIDIYENERGVGYTITHPRDQTAAAQAMAFREWKKTLRKHGLRITNVNMTQLNHRERRENADAMARFAMWKTLMRQVIEYKPDSEDE